MLTNRGAPAAVAELEGNTTEPSALADAAPSALVGRRISNRRSPPNISVSYQPMTSEEESAAATELVRLIARLASARLQQRRGNPCTKN